MGPAPESGAFAGRRSLAVALAVSLLAHAALLAALRVPRQGKQQEPPLVITLTAGFMQVPPAAREASPAPEPEPASSVPPAPAAPPAVAPAALAAPGKAPESSPATAPPPASEPAPPPVPSASAAVPPESLDDQIFLTPDQWTTPPLPQAPPDASQLGGTRVVGRRLVLQLWIDDQGAVRRAVVAPYELRPEVAALLERMVSGLHFTPATIEGRPIGANVRTRLCFDDAGQLDTRSGGCWRFDGDSGR
ncbi:MAG: hypothetical protein KGL68_16175 [Burkholderiales bacterium]|nr:hypothetical protein [Burkholderiales bacterium]